MPATDIDFEREFEELVRDLRALPTAAPQHAREQVRALGEPPRPRTLHDLLLFLSWRRSSAQPSFTACSIPVPAHIRALRPKSSRLAAPTVLHTTAAGLRRLRCSVRRPAHRRCWPPRYRPRRRG